MPLPIEGGFTIPMGVLTDWVQETFARVLPAFVTALCVGSALATLGYIALPGKGAAPAIHHLLKPAPVWIVLRILGALTAIVLFFELGPEWIWGEATGGTVLNDLMIPALVTVAIACLILPFVTEFGLMDFVGVLVERPFRILFRVPGRSAIDATASWLGGSAVGIIVTAEQYDKGYYSAREAATIATNFSIVSIAFCYVIIEVVGLEALFLPFYGALTVSGIICAIIMARVPPLSTKPDSYVIEAGAAAETVEDGPSLPRATQAALAKAECAPPAWRLARTSAYNILDIWLGLIPAGMFIATVALILAEHTSLFSAISAPLVPVLGALGIENSVEAAPAMLIGFADMFLPALAVADVASVETRFIVALVSVGQLIFMSEVGILMLKSSLPLNFIDLVVVFLLRTVILLPLAVLAAALIV